MTHMNAGYGVASIMPRQPFDFAGRTGTIEFETNVYGFGRSWWDVYIVPEDEMLDEIVVRDEGGAGEQLPKRGIVFSFGNSTPCVRVIENYIFTQQWCHWERYLTAFPTDPANTSGAIRRLFRFTVSSTGWTFEVQKQDATFWSFSGLFTPAPSFTRGLIKIEHHAYNPTKDGIDAHRYTYHWDNIRFDGPVIPQRAAYEAAPTFLQLLGAPLGSTAGPVSITTPGGAGFLRAHIYAEPARGPHPMPGYVQASINGGPYFDLPFIKNVPEDRAWATVTAATTFPAGVSNITFRCIARPAGANPWDRDCFNVKDIEIQLAAGAAPLAVPATPVPTSPPPPTPAPTTYSCVRSDGVVIWSGSSPGRVCP
jgi:hypothetical protein